MRSEGMSICTLVMYTREEARGKHKPLGMFLNMMPYETGHRKSKGFPRCLNILESTPELSEVHRAVFNKLVQPSRVPMNILHVRLVYAVLIVGS